MEEAIQALVLRKTPSRDRDDAERKVADEDHIAKARRWYERIAPEVAVHLEKAIPADYLLLMTDLELVACPTSDE